MPNYTMKISGGSNKITVDPTNYNRLPRRSTFQHNILDGDRSESLRSMYYRMQMRYATAGETQQEALRELLYKDELIFLDDGDVPPLTEKKDVYENATYTYAGITNPSSTHIAYTDSSASEPSAEGDFQTTEYSTANYQAIDGDDTNNKETTNPTAGFYLYHKFLVLSSIDAADVQRLRIRISVLSNDGAPVNTDGAVMYGWDGGSWIELARMSSYGAGATRAYLSYSTFDATVAQSLVDSGDNYIRILVQTRNQRVTTNSLNLKMYYVEVEVNEGLSLALSLSNTPELTAGDVTHVKNNDQATTLDRNDYAISTSGKTVTVEAPFAELNGSSEFFYQTDASFPEAGITGDLTLQAMIYPSTVSSHHYVITKYGSAGNRSYQFRHTDDELVLVLSSNGTAITTATSSGAGLQANTWQHVAAVYDASAGTVDFYVNGVFVSQTASMPNSIFDSSADFAVGNIDSGASLLFGGRIAHAAVFDDKRLVAEILASAQRPEEDLSSEGNIIAQWHFNDAAAAATIDNSQGDAGRDLIPYDSGDVIFSALRGVPGTVAAGEEVEVKYGRLFEGRVVDMVERWQGGNPEGDRSRELELRFESLSPEIVGS